MSARQIPMQRLWRRIMFVIGVLLTIPGWAPAAATLPDLGREDGYGLLQLPAGSIADILLSENGQLAAVNAIAIRRLKDFPERLVYVVDLKAQRVRSLIAMPAISCCAFPVFSMTPDGQVIAVGGADGVELFTPSGAKVMDVSLKGPSLNTVLKISRDGRTIVAGKFSGWITTFRRGWSEPLWATSVGADLLDVAVSGDGQTVFAAMPQAIAVLSGATGSVQRRIPYGPSFIVALESSTRADRLAVVWKPDPQHRQDGRILVAMYSAEQRMWSQALQEGQWPLLQMDASGRWVAVSDVLGMQGALVSGAGNIVWRSGADRTAVAAGSDGRVAIADGSRIEVRDPSGRQVIWHGTIPGVAHRVRLAGPTLAVLGSKEPQGMVSDRVWFARIGANGESR